MILLLVILGLKRKVNLFCLLSVCLDRPDVSIIPVMDISPNQCELSGSGSVSKCVVTEGERVHFRCVANSNPAPASVTWQTGSGNDPDLNVDSADHVHDAGTYNCTVVTGPGSHGNDPRLPLGNWKALIVLVKCKLS